MRHYFIDREREIDEFFFFEESFLDVNFKFKSCNDVFSKNEIDEGSKLLIKTFLENVSNNCNSKVLDLGCGYGAIGINLKKHLNDIDLTMSDVVETATNLAETNLEINEVCAKVVTTNLFDNLDEDFDYIVSNPPIKTGKTLLFKFAEDSIKHLKQKGELFVVIRKDLGMESLKNKLKSIYGNCEVVKKHKGFYILKSVKGE